MNGQFTGRHMALLFVTFFGVVIAVNLVNAVYASRTFGGMVVENSYIASQEFNGWLNKARAERALGWTLDVRRDGARVTAALANGGAPISAAAITARADHPLGRLAQRRFAFREVAPGRYESIAPLPAGRWIVHLTVKAPGGSLHRVVDLS